jgi:UDPglucose--hexose-1-phosphate uridylyltransferase
LEILLPDLRRDPITGRWVIIATDRARRPEDFTRERVMPKNGRVCPFCVGNESKTPPEVLAYRTGGAPNHAGWHLRVVPNKFPALRVEGSLDRQGEGLYDRMNGIGAHEVIIESTNHTSSPGSLTEKEYEDTFFAFRDRMMDLKKDRRLRYILLFKNYGENAGATLEHPHSQLIALPVVPKRVIEEMEGAKRHFDYRERCIYCDIIQHESQSQQRVVLETDHFTVLCPYASRFPFEVWIMPRRHASHYETIDTGAVRNLAWVTRVLMRKMEKALESPPFNLIVSTAPVQDAPYDYTHWHIQIIPKLTRVAGFEWGTGFYINPTPPEEAARFLRDIGLP